MAEADTDTSLPEAGQAAACASGGPTGLICVEYPGSVKSVSKMLDTLGGLDTVAKVVEDTPQRRLELRFRPDDVFCKPACGERAKETSLLIRVKRKKRKKKDGQWEYKLCPEVIGPVDTTFKFGALCDFQYLPMEKVAPAAGSSGGGVHYRSIYDQIYFDKLVDSSWMDQSTPPAPLFLPPAAFSRMDVPQDYHFRRETANEKTLATRLGPEGGASSSSAKAGAAANPPPYNIIGRTRQRRSHHAIFVTFDVEKVPVKARHIALEQLKVKFIRPEDQAAVRRHFEERPIWSKNALHALTGIAPDRLKFIVPCLAYYFTTGPWRNQWVRFGYDPRRTPEAANFQTLDYRVRLQGGGRHKVKAKRSYANYLLPYKAMNWSKSKTSVIDRGTFSSMAEGAEAGPSGPAQQQESTDLQQEEEDKKKDVYMFRPGRMPPYRQMFYQFNDIMVDEAQDVIKSNRRQECNDERNGWFKSGTDAELREILSKQISRHLVEERRGEDDAGDGGTASNTAGAILEDDEDDMLDDEEDDGNLEESSDDDDDEQDVNKVISDVMAATGSINLAEGEEK